MIEMTSRLEPVTSSASKAPTPADGSVDRIVIGVNVALVENAEDDVDADDGGEDEEHLIIERRLEGEGRAFEFGRDRGRHADFLFGGLHRVDRSPERNAGRGVEGDERRRELPEVIELERRRRRFDAGDRGKLHLPATGGRNVNVLQ